MKRAIMIGSLALLLGGCASTRTVGIASPGNISPEQAVIRAAAAAPGGVKGVFELTVRATGRQDGFLYLNSEADYRDQRCLTIAVPPEVAQAMAQRFRAEPDRYFVGKRIAIRGTAHRVRIVFLANGSPTSKYYYQTHVELVSLDQLSVEG